MGRWTRLGLSVLWMLLCRLNAGTCQEKVQGFIGDAVLLPCVYTEDDRLLSVFWRDKNDNNILDIINNVPNNSTQHQRFRGRVLSDPSLYQKGNFSVTLKNVQQDDAGPYECVIPLENFQLRVTLSVSGKRVEATPPGPAGGAAVTPTSLHLVLLSVPLSVFFSSRTC
ncbi:programmed cell death 1 ligand 1 isoform X2 [Dicentrarchus labrax]|uniref:programmed cell death 1 ligand 1 isoform X2 n=1 Tax=Dicentrarchus labrax TaxID=13489 RepID=UPI0021F68AF8|nr:programmed cell death 1 ligand 1 isoform X2 [Dicentrarchus labrax]XP_051282965.1 programmed cell death 1 ligand 1 isoform X2 [Dicentrarchus labrax]